MEMVSSETVGGGGRCYLFLKGGKVLELYLSGCLGVKFMADRLYVSGGQSNASPENVSCLSYGFNLLRHKCIEENKGYFTISPTYMLYAF